MKILAFETSCDDTAVAIVENGTEVLVSKRVSQLEHNDWGGVVPEIAARLHAENWKSVLESALADSGLSMDEIDAIACTQGPGLQTSLLTGTTAASFMAQLYDKPLIPVQHIYGHLCSVFLERELDVAKFPMLTFTVSGGHTEIYYSQTATSVQKVSQTRDDAAGEAFDKVAKMLGLGYPGGPIVSKMAENGDRKKYAFPIPNLGKASLEFSFSGVKAAVRRLIEKEYPELLEKPSLPAGHLSQGERVKKEEFIWDVCASFEDTVKRIFLKRLAIALEKYPETKTVSFVGGVSANNHIKKGFKSFLQLYGIKFLTPEKLEYSTDNAAMIASGAYFLVQEKGLDHFKPKFVEAVSRMEMS